MQKMTIVFPGSFMNYREIDPDMYEEYLAVMETGLFDILLFNFDEWLAGDKFRITGTENSPSKAIYRGWMLKPEKYGELYKTLHDRGVLLITDPDAYRNTHLFPNVYPHIRDDTAEMMLFANGKVDVEKAKKRFRLFMVKDSVKSVKGTEFPAYFDHTISQAKFDEWMKVFYKYRGDLLTGDICIKEYLDLKRYNGITNEFRVFYADHEIVSICRNSNQPAYTAELADGTWKIIEAGDGGVSGLSPGQNLEAYYRALYNALKRVDEQARFIEQKVEKMEKRCRCINPPNNTPFVKNGVYKWVYIIDGYAAVHESGIMWGEGEINFLKHFQIVSGKWSDINSD